MSQAAYLPVQVLRRYVTDLEAALVVCQAEPGVKPVHRLRTGTRRVEAMLLVLDLIPALPEHKKRSTELRKALTHLRRAAGVVRDLDVHREMLEAFAQEEHRLAHAEETLTVSTAPDGIPNVAPTDPEPQAAAALQHSAEELRQKMAHTRVAAAEALQETLHKRQSRTTLAAERLLHVLAPAAHTPLPLEKLLATTETVLRRKGRLTPTRLTKLDEEKLHNLRKAAKAARYIAETASDDEALHAAARRYEALQEAGGLWHDALELARASRHAFGRHHPLTALYRTARKQRLAEYRTALLRDLGGPETTVAQDEDPQPPAVAQALSRPSTRRRTRPKAVATV